MDVLLSQWRGRAIIVLNAEWTVETVDPQFTAFVKSFDSVYSFLPLAIQVSHATLSAGPHYTRQATCKDPLYQMYEACTW